MHKTNSDTASFKHNNLIFQLLREYKEKSTKQNRKQLIHIIVFVFSVLSSNKTFLRLLEKVNLKLKLQRIKWIYSLKKKKKTNLSDSIKEAMKD